MSLSRSFLHDFRPFFRMFEDKSISHPAFCYGASRFGTPRHGWPTYRGLGWNNEPNVDLTDKGDSFLVEADLPGVKRENLEVRVGDKGRSLIIEAKTVERTEGGKAKEEAKPNESGSLYSERVSEFSRKLWLPEAVDTANIKAKLEDGVLRLQVPKSKEDGSVRVDVA